MQVAVGSLVSITGLVFTLEKVGFNHFSILFDVNLFDVNYSILVALEIIFDCSLVSSSSLLFSPVDDQFLCSRFQFRYASKDLGILILSSHLQNGFRESVALSSSSGVLLSSAEQECPLRKTANLFSFLEIRCTFTAKCKSQSTHVVSLPAARYILFVRCNGMSSWNDWW